MLSQSALRILRRLLGAPARAAAPPVDTPLLLDGNTAVALTEAALGEAAGLGAGFPANGADLAWRAEQARRGRDLAGAPLASLGAADPRGALAVAMGQALAGLRATCFLSGPDLAASRDLLQVAVGRRLPLVIHGVGRALAGPGPALGGDHVAWHLAAEAGVPVLVAVNVQEAVDLTLLARHLAEQALTPVLVAMDGETALGVQDARLPTASQLKSWLGHAGNRVPAPTPAQKLLFGDYRRRVPRWHDPDRPVLLGAPLPPEAWGPAQAAGEVFWAAHMPQLLDGAWAGLARHTGRVHHPLAAHRLEDASLVLVAQGAAVETAQLVADHLRAVRQLKVGVLGIRCLSPFPAAEVVRLLGGAGRVAVLERVGAPLDGEPPLWRALGAALGNRPRSQWRSVLYGLGGLPLAAADLVALGRQWETLPGPRLYLGLGFSQAASPYPKRQVVLDQLRRAYPGIAGLGLRGFGTPPEQRVERAISLALYRRAGGVGEGLALEAASLLQRLLGGGVRAHLGIPAPWGAPQVDRVSLAAQPLPDPGDRPRVDLALLLGEPDLPGLHPEEGLGGALLVPSALPDDTALWARLAPSVRNALRHSGVALFRVPPPAGPEAGHPAYLLGALCGVLVAIGRLDVPQRRLLVQYQQILETAGEPVADRLGQFQAGLERPHRVALANLPDPALPAATDDLAPALVRRLGRGEDGHASLPRFWDQVGVLYRAGDADRELTPDPQLALGAVPARSAGFRDLSPGRAHLPVLDPAACTACGACWRACPEGALGALALSPARLLESALRPAGAEALRPQVTRLAGLLRDRCRGATPPVATEALLAEVGAPLLTRSGLSPERQAALAQGLDALGTWFGELPLVAGEALFRDAEAQTPGSGLLLALALDPEGCKGCGLCVQVCASRALTRVPQDPEVLDRARRLRDLWERLPDSAPETLARLAAHPGLVAGAAPLLSRAVAGALTGGDGMEPGSGARLALRLFLAAVEGQQVPRQAALLERVRAARERVTGRLRELLADALPAAELDALERGLGHGARARGGVGGLLGQVLESTSAQLDAGRLTRLAELARDLGEWAWHLAEGPQGGGRARWGVVLTAGGDLTWAAAFPHNPWAGPVLLDPAREGAALAAGLLEGQWRQASAGLALLRKAALELDRPAEAAHLWAGLEHLDWRALEPEERALCPPLLLVGEAGPLLGSGLGHLISLLGGELPVKVLALADLDLGLAAPAGLGLPLASQPDPSLDLGLLALSQRQAYLAQTSLGAPEHLAASLTQALDHPGPALVYLHAPRPGRHGFAPERTLERAWRAVAARVSPLFRYDPAAPGVFGTRLDLTGNPALGETWVADAETPSLAHWALEEGRFAHLFQPLAEDAPGPAPLLEYLALEPAARRRRTPFLDTHEEGMPRRLGLDPRLTQACLARLDAWRLLQELAGLVTPFTARVQQEAETRLGEVHRAELQAQRADYETRLERLETRLREDTRQALRGRLLQLAGYGDLASPPEGP